MRRHVASSSGGSRSLLERHVAFAEPVREFLARQGISALILQRWCFASFESRADPQLSTTPGSMKTATKFPPIPDRVLSTLRFVQAGFDCHIVPYSAQAATAIRHKPKEAGQRYG
jgi:hypothetical protein